MQAYLKLFKKGAEVFNVDTKSAASLFSLTPEELKDFLDWSQTKL